MTVFVNSYILEFIYNKVIELIRIYLFYYLRSVI